MIPSHPFNQARWFRTFLENTEDWRPPHKKLTPESFARIFRVSRRAAFRYQANEAKIPEPIRTLIVLVCARKITLHDIENPLDHPLLDQLPYKQGNKVIDPQQPRKRK